MSVLIIAGLGVALVLLLILVLKIHPMISLLLGSLFLLAATPADLQLKTLLADSRIAIQGTSGQSWVGLDSAPPNGRFRIWDKQLPTDEFATVTLQRATPEELVEAQLATQRLPAQAVWYRIVDSQSELVQGQQLIAEEQINALATSSWNSLGGRLADGFAKTFRKLGIPVTMAAIVGICLLRSGAASRLVAAIVHLFGPRGTAPALTASGFVLGIPVFFDNVFYLLLPLAKAVGRERPAQYLTCVMAIIVGATMAHSLVPPTPGPLYVAAQMQVSVGLMMVGGFLVGSIAASCGFLYGRFCHRFIHLSPQDSSESGDLSADSPLAMPLWLAALPIGLPILLLGGSEIVEVLAARYDGWRPLHSWTSTFNDPSLIFIGAALVAMALLQRYGGREGVRGAVAQGLSDAGVIVLLTSAGGAFGASLQQLDLASEIGRQLNPEAAATGGLSAWSLLVVAFGLTTIVRAAQGSATVAMLTSSAIVAPLLAEMVDSGTLPFHPLYVALAVGCGSKPLPWMNDSGFWQVTTMTGMSPTQTLKSFSVALTIMGFVGFAVVLLGARLFPLTP